MVIFHEAESLPVDFVLHKAIEVSLVAEMSEKLTNIVHGPRVEGGTSRMSVGCMGGGGEREREMIPGTSLWTILTDYLSISNLFRYPTYVQE